MSNNKSLKPNLLTIAVPLIDNMISTSITLPLEMLEAARTYTQMTGCHTHHMQVLFCSDTQEKPIKTTGGLTLSPDTLYSDTPAVDIILVPALWRNPLTQIKKNKPLIQWLKHCSNDTFISAGGTGVVFLAEAKLLEHQPASTHWFYLKKLQNRYPNIKFKPNHLITRSGRIYCAGSVNSIADLMVHFIQIFMGASIALKVEQQFSHEIRKPYEEICFSSDAISNYHDEAIVLLLEWIKHNYSQTISLIDMGKIVGLQSRTLSRRFKQATNLSPAAYLKHIRLKESKELLKNSNLSISEIAESVGYNDPNYFSRIFTHRYKLTPSNFRQSMREKLFQLNS